ncbi:16S rRNA (uracil(1498)-N(3))-methyltransferase [Wohlfahrtiimonas chitiniclastica]|uniref:16S rRNA (uracil(1498)-N(3))-methyltransferase n=1 Tax=Wohlfahrtiimonas chitiniclastica TaxID=400946 RepID=UPI000B980652|nr:16S rRNA (uracil(1498)-N(3))-methyltransferase [Wohlfahrtiimonas chitiniclastica]OYQ74710.1 16S rRNA (uracil(1498)-N(3))-methyltransferase [Wohlfahrtiimonas chitiniclastica]
MRIYTQEPLAPHATVELKDPQFNHIVRVMRKKVGDHLVLFNGEGGEYPAIIHDIDKRSLTVTLHAHIAIDRSAPFDVHLIQSFAKFDKMDFVFQKAVELGVNRITPFMSEHSSFKLNDSDKQEKKLSHWQGILESACEQSGLNKVPMLTPFASLKNIESLLLDRPYLILSPTAECSLGHWIKNHHTEHAFGIIIGPEGGFSEAELAWLSSQNNCHPVTLGPRILRTETAALSVISSLHALLGDWA